MARILVIDDEADMRALLEQILVAAGHEVLVAADGAEGVRECAANEVDLVLTDIYMPNQEGLETIMELKRRFPHVGIVAMSGRADAGNVLTMAHKLGAVEVLQKPFSGDEALAAVDKALARG